MKRALLPIVIVVAVSAFSSCDLIINSALSPDAPSSVSASDGETGYILVSWGSVASTSSTGRVFSRYRLWKDGAWLGDTTSTSYSDYAVSSGVVYHYRVDAVYTDDSVSSQILGDDGFCVDATLSFRSTPGPVGQSGGTRWYRTWLQKGFTYSFDNAAGTFTIVVYYGRSISGVDRTITTTGGNASFVADRSGIAILRIDVDSGGSLYAEY